MAVLTGGYTDPNEIYLGAYRTSNPIERAMRPDSRVRGEDQGIGSEAMIQARLDALDELLAETDPVDFIALALIKDEKNRLKVKLQNMRGNLSSEIGQMNLDAFSAGNEVATQYDMMEQNPAMGSGVQGYWEPVPGDMTGVGGTWIPQGGTSPAPQYGAVMPNQGYITQIGQRGPEVSTYGRTAPGQMNWMQDIVTPQGLRPLAGGYPLDPVQQQQAVLWQLYNTRKPTSIDQWLKMKPDAEIIAEQWLQKSEALKPGQKTQTTDWIAASAR